MVDINNHERYALMHVIHLVIVGSDAETLCFCRLLWILVAAYERTYGPCCADQGGVLGLCAPHIARTKPQTAPYICAQHGPYGLLSAAFRMHGNLQMPLSQTDRRINLHMK